MYPGHGILYSPGSRTTLVMQARLRDNVYSVKPGRTAQPGHCRSRDAPMPQPTIARHASGATADTIVAASVAPRAPTSLKIILK